MLRACFRNTNSVHRKAASRPTIASLVGPQLRKWSRLFAILPGGAPVLPRSPHLGGGTPSRRPEKAHSGGQPAMQVKRPFEYLSKVVVPVNYVLRFQPDLEAFTFSGSESVSVEVKEAINSITVNVVDIKISVAFFIPEESNKVTGEVSYDDDSEKATITFASQLQPGKGALHLEFTGELNNRMKGFYRSRYTLPSGEERYAAVTQFEATDARRAFPCWDEPSFKATFDVTLVVPQDRTALSNMPVKKESELDSDGSWKVLEYETTPVMSTYLLAFIVGDFDYLEAKDVDGVKIRVFTPVGKKEQGQFALDVAVKTLPFYKDYFQIAYPLPKMDLIAIPDFMSGAMENWGLVTYRETALLIDPENSSSRAKQWVALVVGHELAHQWFGNLVTMEWWTHLWLNEGFASWIEYLCVDKLFPSYQIWTQFVNTDLASALKLDALHTSHPIEVPVGHPTEVDEIFDDISYSKGASVIRMLHGYIEDKDFRKGMNYYLTKFKYNNASTEDLWACLERASGKPVGDVMRTWTKQMGFPVLNVSQSQDENNRILTVKQQKFCADGKLEGDSPQWMIPCEICTSFSPTKPVKTVLITEPSSTYTIKNVKPGDWMKLNCGSVGVYRVQYSQEMLDSLLEGIKNKSLLPTDRLEIESDLFALARAGMTSSVDVLNVIQAYKNEDNYTVWNDITQNLSNIAMLLQYTDFYEQYKLFACDLYRTVAESVGWEKEEGEGHLTSLLRELVLCRMGTYDDEKTVREAKRRFQDHLSETNLLSADLKLAVYLTVLKHGDEATLDSMLKLYDKADLLEEKVRIGRSLGAVQDEKLLRRVLDFAMSDKVRSQDTIFVIVGVTRSAEGRKIAWQFVKDNWKELYARYQGGFLVARLVKCTTDGFASEEMAKEVEAFFTAHPAPSAERNIQQSCENIRLNARWMTNESARVGQFLINYSQTSK